MSWIEAISDLKNVTKQIYGYGDRIFYILFYISEYRVKLLCVLQFLEWLKFEKRINLIYLNIPTGN